MQIISMVLEPLEVLESSELLVLLPTLYMPVELLEMPVELVRYGAKFGGTEVIAEELDVVVIMVVVAVVGFCTTYRAGGG